MRCNDLSANAPRFISNSGTNKHIDYVSKVEKDGTISLKENGWYDTDEMIESHRAGTELSTLIARYQNGDLSALNQVNGFYADVCDAPKNLAEAMQYVLNAQGIFDALPVDKKKLYGSDWRKWLADLGSDDWLKAMNISTGDKDPDQKEKEEVSSDEQEQ